MAVEKLPTVAMDKIIAVGNKPIIGWKRTTERRTRSRTVTTESSLQVTAWQILGVGIAGAAAYILVKPAIDQARGSPPRPVDVPWLIQIMTPIPSGIARLLGIIR